VNLRAALTTTLRTYIRVWLSRQRLRTQLPISADGNGKTAAPFQRSWKYDVADMLVREAVAINGLWKQLGDCTVPDDLDVLIADRKQLAEKIQAKAKFYVRVKRACQRHKVAVVRDLPKDVLRDLGTRREDR
jgi:hypothetical protein